MVDVPHTVFEYAAVWDEKHRLPALDTTPPLALTPDDDGAGQ
jgi:hypothetical protein